MMLLDGEVMKEKTEIILLHLLRLCSLSYCLHLSYYYHNLVDTKTIITAISRINCYCEMLYKLKDTINKSSQETQNMTLEEDLIQFIFILDTI